MTEIVAKVVKKQKIAAQILRHIIIGRINRSGNSSCSVPVVDSLDDRPVITKDGQLVYVKLSSPVIIQPDPTPIFEELTEYTNLFFNPEPEIAEDKIECVIINENANPLFAIGVGVKAIDGIDGISFQVYSESSESVMVVYLYSFENISFDAFGLGEIEFRIGWQKLTIDFSDPEETTQSIEYIDFTELPTHTGAWSISDSGAVNVADVGKYLNTESYVEGSHTHTDTDFELETVYPRIYLNPEPRKLSVVNPDWNPEINFSISFDKFSLIYIPESYVPEWEEITENFIKQVEAPAVVEGGYWYDYTNLYYESGGSWIMDGQALIAPREYGEENVGYVGDLWVNTTDNTLFQAVEGASPSDPEAMLIVLSETLAYGYTFEDFGPYEKGWLKVEDEGGTVTPVDYDDIPEIPEATITSSLESLELVKEELKEYISDNAWVSPQPIYSDGQLYISVDGEWVAISGGRE